MYMHLAKALYGTLLTALFFWKDLTGAGYLMEQGFVMNLYDTHIANKMIDVPPNAPFSSTQ